MYTDREKGYIREILGRCQEISCKDKEGGMWVLPLCIDIAMESCILAVLIFADRTKRTYVSLFFARTVVNSIIFTVYLSGILWKQDWS